MTKTLTVAMRDVRVGDQIHNNLAYHPSAAWLTVREIKTMKSGFIGLVTDVYTEWKHPDEGIKVKRYA